MFHHIIMPDSWFAVIWERLVLAVLLAICFSYTFVASFSISLHAIGYGESIGKQVLLVITYLLDAVLFADFIMRFNMASETTTGNYNYLRTLARKFLRNRFLSYFGYSQIMSYLCQKCKKIWGSPTSFSK